MSSLGKLTYSPFYLNIIKHFDKNIIFKKNNEGFVILLQKLFIFDNAM